MLAARCCLRSYPLTAATDHWCTYQDDAPAAMPACSRTCTTHRTRGTRPPKLRTFGKQSSRPSSWLVMCGSSGAATDDRTGSTTCYRMANTLHQPTATWPPAAAQPVPSPALRSATIHCSIRLECARSRGNSPRSDRDLKFTISERISVNIKYFTISCICAPGTNPVQAEGACRWSSGRSLHVPTRGSALTQHSQHARIHLLTDPPRCHTHPRGSYLRWRGSGSPDICEDARRHRSGCHLSVPTKGHPPWTQGARGRGLRPRASVQGTRRTLAPSEFPRAGTRPVFPAGSLTDFPADYRRLCRVELSLLQTRAARCDTRRARSSFCARLRWRTRTQAPTLAPALALTLVGRMNRRRALADRLGRSRRPRSRKALRRRIATNWLTSVVDDRGVHTQNKITIIK